jgi:hypothetical protein
MGSCVLCRNIKFQNQSTSIYYLVICFSLVYLSSFSKLFTLVSANDGIILNDRLGKILKEAFYFILF